MMFGKRMQIFSRDRTISRLEALKSRRNGMLTSSMDTSRQDRLLQDPKRPTQDLKPRSPILERNL